MKIDSEFSWRPGSFQLEDKHELHCELIQPLNFQRRSDIPYEWENCRVWGIQKPHRIIEHERDSPKVNVFCALSQRKLYGPFFFIEATVTGHSYLDMLEPQLRQDLDDDFIFQQDGAPPHFHNAVRAYLNTEMSDRWIGRAGIRDRCFMTWPPRSPDMTASAALIETKISAAAPAKDQISADFKYNKVVSNHASSCRLYGEDDEEMGGLLQTMLSQSDPPPPALLGMTCQEVESASGVIIDTILVTLEMRLTGFLEFGKDAATLSARGFDGSLSIFLNKGSDWLLTGEDKISVTTRRGYDLQDSLLMWTWCNRRYAHFVPKKGGQVPTSLVGDGTMGT
ncbi:hypothetical protein ANN_16989 [Periplaneta americana]|uniref:Uncharacterized protein n=1 Tax=Periplaneta americana TaxID=6978 RepID=A0ABQ8SRN0_PERAM|nr:hypothetical protein ANN_16989 [Periplaneta americana]